MTNETENRDKIRWGELAIVWLILTIVTVTGSLTVIPHLMPRPASNTMHLSILTVVVFSVTAAPVGSFIYAIAAYGLRHWRTNATTEPPPDGPALHGNNPVTVVWIVVSTFLCVFLLIWGLAALSSDETAGASGRSITVDVTGQQWLWTYHYPSTGVTSEVLYLPEGERVNFDVTSLDVVHGFWIVQMGVKIDANPGETTTTAVTPDKLGTFDVRCAEFCGLYHAYMTSTVRVVTPQKFQAWLTSQKA